MKVIHIFFNSNLFAKNIVEMIRSRNNYFYDAKIQFITFSVELYEKYKDDIDIELCSLNVRDFRIVRIYAKRCDRIIVHGFTNPFQVVFLPRKLCHKVVWRSWGHDVWVFSSNKTIKGVIKRISKKVFERKVRSFYMLAGHNFIDIYNLNYNYCHDNIKQLEYPIFFDKEGINVLNSIECKPHDQFNIMIGHSGLSNDNHIEILKILKRLESFNIHIYLVLSYGDEDYINKVICAANSLWYKEKITIVDKTMSTLEYYRFLKSMDIAIFDGKKSYALGNIEALLYFRKIIFLNDEGIIAAAFSEKGIPFKKTRDLNRLSFESIIEKPTYDEIKMNDVTIRPYEEVLESWRVAHGCK